MEPRGVALWVWNARIRAMLGLLLLWQSALACVSEDPLKEYKESFVRMMGEEPYSSFFRPDIPNWQNLKSVKSGSVAADPKVGRAMGNDRAGNVLSGRDHGSEEMEGATSTNLEAGPLYAVYLFNSDLPDVKVLLHGGKGRVEQQLQRGDRVLIRTKKQKSLRLQGKRDGREFTLDSPTFCRAKFGAAQSGLALWAISSDRGFLTGVYLGDTVTVNKSLVYHQPWPKSSLGPNSGEHILQIKSQRYVWQYEDPKLPPTLLPDLFKDYKESFIRMMDEKFYRSFFRPEIPRWQYLDSLSAAADQKAKGALGNDPAGSGPLFAAYLCNRDMEIWFSYTDDLEKARVQELKSGDCVFFRTLKWTPLRLRTKRLVEGIWRDFTLDSKTFGKAKFGEAKSGLALWTISSDSGFLTGVYMGDTVTVYKAFVYHQPWPEHPLRHYTWQYENPTMPPICLPDNKGDRN